jgi:hypothetical protein
MDSKIEKIMGKRGIFSYEKTKNRCKERGHTQERKTDGKVT